LKSFYLLFLEKLEIEVIAYLQKNNRNSLKLRYRKYRKHRSDIWGRIAQLGKENYFTSQIAKFAKIELRNSVRHTRKRKGSFRRFGVSEITQALKQSEYNYSITVKAEPKKKKIPNLSGRLWLLAKKFKYFYNMKIRNQPLRKILKPKPSFRAKSQHHLLYEKRFGYQANDINRVRIETRIDVLLYRLTFIPYIWDARRLIRHSLVYILKPAFFYFRKNKTDRFSLTKKFFSYFLVKKYFHTLSYFNGLTLKPHYAFWRKSVISKMLNENQLFCFPPQYLLMKYATMVGFLIKNPVPSNIGYPWPGTLLSFLGSALYYQ